MGAQESFPVSPPPAPYPSSPNTLSVLSNPNNFRVPKHSWPAPLHPFAHHSPRLDSQQLSNW